MHIKLFGIVESLEMRRHALKQLLHFAASGGATPQLAGGLRGALLIAAHSRALSAAGAGAAAAALPAAAVARWAPWARLFSAEADAAQAATPADGPLAVDHGALTAEHGQEQEQQEQPQQPEQSQPQERRRRREPRASEDPDLGRLQACASAADMRAWRADLESEGRFGAEQLAALFRAVGNNRQGLGDEEREAYLRELLREAAEGAVPLNGKAGEQRAVAPVQGWGAPCTAARATRGPAASLHVSRLPVVHLHTGERLATTT